MTITDQEAIKRLKRLAEFDIPPAATAWDRMALTRAIEVLEARGEAVAWIAESEPFGRALSFHRKTVEPHVKYGGTITPLYAAPPAPTVTDDAMREKIARLIHPSAFALDRTTRASSPAFHNKWIKLYYLEYETIRDAYERADAILAALQVGPKP